MAVAAVDTPIALRNADDSDSSSSSSKRGNQNLPTVTATFKHESSPADYNVKNVTKYEGQMQTIGQAHGGFQTSVTKGMKSHAVSGGISSHTAHRTVHTANNADVFTMSPTHHQRTAVHYGQHVHGQHVHGHHVHGHHTMQASRVHSTATTGKSHSQRTAAYTTSPVINQTASYSAGQRQVVTGEERVVGYNTRVDESQTIILGERIIEHEVRIPKKIIVEDVVEKVIVVPERRVREEMSEEIAIMQEKIIEIAKPIIQEKIVEVPEIEYVEKIVEIVEVVVQEKIREVPKIEVQERIVEIPKIVHQEKIVEIPEVEYREFPVEKVVEVPEVREQVMYKEIPVPQYVEKPVPEYVQVEELVDVRRAVPIPIEAITTLEFKLPQIRPHWKTVDVPLYVPRFVEIPVPFEAMDTSTLQHADHYAQQVALLGVQTATSLCELEELARVVKQADFQSAMKRTPNHDLAATLVQAWQSGQLQITESHHIQSKITSTSIAGGKMSYPPYAPTSVVSGGHVKKSKKKSPRF